MDVILEAIQFNHDPNSASVDAFNIRRNETEFVSVPEWRRGVSVKPEDSLAAYATCETRGNTIAIQAKFKSAGATDNKIRVRAIEARAHRRQALGCGPLSLLVRAFSSARRGRFGNILGEVKEKPINFNDSGETDFETFQLQNVRLWSAGVSVSNTEWRWQFRAKPSGHWTDFALTKHRIYSVLEVPKCPWEQTPYNKENTQIPWADALEYACDWAASARDIDEGASLVTRNINDLGLGRLGYSGSPFYSCPNFNCTQFLQLLSGRTGIPARMNCSDCATAVSSLANLLGCDLRQLQLGPEEILTNPIKKIGQHGEAKTEFFGHEVAWKGTVTEEGKVFDACLQVDGDDHPEVPPFDALVPAKIPFGRADEKHYRFRLSPSLILKPDTLTCRKIGFSVHGNCRALDQKQVDFLKRHYDFATWGEVPSKKYLLSVDHHFFEGLLLPEWMLKRPILQPQFADSVRAFQLLWFSPDDQEMLLRLDLFELETWQQAREFMLRELGEFHQLHALRFLDPSIGDVSFVETGDVSVLFARSDLVLLVRSAGRKSISVLQTAILINQLLGQAQE